METQWLPQEPFRRALLGLVSLRGTVRCCLEATTNLPPAANWLDLTNTRTISNGLVYVTNSASGSAEYYRLNHDNDGRLDCLICGDDGGGIGICQLWRNSTLPSNTHPAVPGGLSLGLAGPFVVLGWNAASDAETSASGLTCNVRIGTTPGGPDALVPISLSERRRQLPKLGNTQLRQNALFRRQDGTTYYWSVQAVDGVFAGSAFSAEGEFTTSVVFASTNCIPVLGDTNGDGIVDSVELGMVLSNYFPHSPWLQMTNVAGLGSTNVTFALTNDLAGAFGVEYTNNFVDWYFLGPATPRYLFTDTNATAEPQRYYRLRWP